jgi:hypothetical protein
MKHYLVAAAAMLSLVTWIVPAQAAAELLVLSSTHSDLQVGEIVDGASKLTLPAGATVTLVAESGETVTLDGPFEGVPAAGSGGGDPGLLKKLSMLVGGPSQDASAVGAVRAANTSTPDDPWVINISRSGHHCVRGGTQPVLWRPSAKQASALSLKQMSPAKRAKATWARGEATLTWPAKMAFADGATYMVRLRGSSTAKRLVLHVVPADLPSDVHRAVWMSDAGCANQARRLLATLK